MSLIATVQEQIQQVEELIAQLEQSMTTGADRRPSVAANIRALEKERRTLHQEFFRAAELAKVDVYRYRILPSQRATLNGLTSAWKEFQRMLSSVYDSLKGGARPQRRFKKIADDTTPSIELGF